jgi:hypothetical protein
MVLFVIARSMAGFGDFRPGQYTSGAFDVLRAKVDPREGARMRCATRIWAPPVLTAVL